MKRVDLTGGIRMTRRRHIGSVLEVVRATWAQILLGLIGGGVFIYFSPQEGPLKVLDHIGIGLIVASVVTLFLQLREVKDFFLSVARAVLIEDAYLRRLGRPSQRQLRLAAASAILHDLAKNPKYDAEGLGKWVDDVLFEKSLPSDEPGSGLYRERYRDNVTLEFITLRKALQEVGALVEGVPKENLDLEVVKQTTTTRYTVLAPRANAKEYKDYPVPLSGKSSDMPDVFPLGKRLRFWVGNSEEKAAEVELELSDHPRGGIEFAAKKPQAIAFVDGEAEVWTRLIEYKLPAREPFVVMTMSHLTHDLRAEVSIVGTTRGFVLDGNIISFAGKRAIDYAVNGIALEYPGWLFEDHGYFVWWWEETN